MIHSGDFGHKGLVADGAAEPATALTPSQAESKGNCTKSIHGDVGSRGKQMLSAFGGAYYFPGVAKAIQGGLWSKDNPDGYTILAIAENRQSIPLLQERLAQIAPIPREAFFYDSFQGIERFRKALANLLMTTFMKGTEIDPAHICVQAGCGAMLSSIFNMLGEKGDSVLIPAPYYPGFDFDASASAGLVTISVHTPQEGSLVPALSAAAEAAAADGHPVRAVLLTNPNNPLGIIYSDEQLQSMMDWAVDSGVHLISDEVYANSVFGPGAQFTSMAALLAQALEKDPSNADRLKAFVHVVFGISKDFCASGFRVGALYTQNAGLVRACASAGYFAGVSNIVQHGLAEVFEDSDFLRSFVGKNCRHLGDAYDKLAGALTEAEIPFVPAVGAMSVWMDLSRGLKGEGWAAERALWNRFVDEGNVVLTPGECCHAKQPGWFRACYAWGDVNSLPTTVQRIAKIIGS